MKAEMLLFPVFKTVLCVTNMFSSKNSVVWKNVVNFKNQPSLKSVEFNKKWSKILNYAKSAGIFQKLSTKPSCSPNLKSNGLKLQILRPGKNMWDKYKELNLLLGCVFVFLLRLGRISQFLSQLPHSNNTRQLESSLLDLPSFALLVQCPLNWLLPSCPPKKSTTFVFGVRDCGSRVAFLRAWVVFHATTHQKLNIRF